MIVLPLGNEAEHVLPQVIPAGLEAISPAPLPDLLTVRVTGLAATVRVAVPLNPLLDAVMVAVPGPTAVASPEGLIVATAPSPELQAKETPAMVLPLSSLAVAANCCVAPIAMLAAGGVTVMLAICGRSDPFPSHPARIASPSMLIRAIIGAMVRSNRRTKRPHRDRPGFRAESEVNPRLASMIAELRVTP
jgi:hypothetical protein